MADVWTSQMCAGLFEGDHMKLIFFLLVGVSGLIAQVDSVYTEGKIVTGDMISATEIEICISNYPFGRQWIPIKKVDRFVLRNGVIILGKEVPEQVYASFVEDLNRVYWKRAMHQFPNYNSLKHGYSKNWRSGHKTK